MKETEFNWKKVYLLAYKIDDYTINAVKELVELTKQSNFINFNLTKSKLDSYDIKAAESKINCAPKVTLTFKDGSSVIFHGVEKITDYCNSKTNPITELGISFGYSLRGDSGIINFSDRSSITFLASGSETFVRAFQSKAETLQYDSRVWWNVLYFNNLYSFLEPIILLIFCYISLACAKMFVTIGLVGITFSHLASVMSESTSFVGLGLLSLIITPFFGLLVVDKLKEAAFPKFTILFGRGIDSSDRAKTIRRIIFVAPITLVLIPFLVNKLSN